MKKHNLFIEKILDYISTNLFWLKIMLQSCKITGLSYVVLQIIIQLTPLIMVGIWKQIIDEFERIYKYMNVGMYIWILIAIYIAVKVINSILSSISVILEDKIYRRTRYSLNMIVIKKMSQLDASFFADPKNADITDIAQSSEIYMAKRLPEKVSEVVGIIAFITELITFLVYSPLGGILFLITYIPGAINSYKYKKKLDEFSLRNVPQERERSYYKSILTTDTYAKDLRLYNLKSYMMEKYDVLRAKVHDEREKIFKSNTIISFLLSLLTYSGVITIIVISAVSVIFGKSTIGMLTLYVGLAQTTGRDFQNIISNVAFSVMADTEQTKRYMQFINYEHKITVKNSQHISCCPSIEFQNVYFKYPNCDEYAIENMNFKIESGEKVAIVGINGAGKSTVLKLLLRFYEPTSGKILINGYDIKEYSLNELYKAFAVCLQDVNTYAMTLRENIAISDTKKIDDMSAIVEAANKTGLDEIANELPKKYESQMTRDFYEDGFELSGGQKQKVALSRAFFKNSKFVILDEPSSALDPVAEDMIFRSFKEICCDRGGILVSHRLSSIIMVDKILLLESGKIIESGTHDELMNAHGKYAEMYSIQANKYKVVE